MKQVNNTAKAGATDKGAKEMFSPVRVQNVLQDWFRSEWIDLREKENAASQLAFRYEKEALSGVRCAVKANIHLPETKATRFDMVHEVVVEVIDSIGGNEEGIVAISSVCASYLLAHLIAADAKEKKEAIEPLAWFIQGDFEAIDLSTQSGRGYLLYYYLKARGAQGSNEEFEQFCAWCQNNEQDQEEDNFQEVAA